VNGRTKPDQHFIKLQHKITPQDRFPIIRNRRFASIGPTYGQLLDFGQWNMIQVGEWISQKGMLDELALVGDYVDGGVFGGVSVLWGVFGDQSRHVE
jgi:hypothetical protein